MVSGYDKQPEEPPASTRGRLIALAFLAFVALVIWRLATRT